MSFVFNKEDKNVYSEMLQTAYIAYFSHWNAKIV